MVVIWVRRRVFGACHRVIVRGIRNWRVIKEELPRISIFRKGIQVRGTFHVNFILSLIGVLNRVTLRVNSMFKYDWHAK